MDDAGSSAAEEKVAIMRVSEAFSSPEAYMYLHGAKGSVSGITFLQWEEEISLAMLKVRLDAFFMHRSS